MAEFVDGLKRVMGSNGRKLSDTKGRGKAEETVSVAVTEYISPEEARLRLGIMAFESALARSRGTAIVNMGQSQIDELEIAGRMNGFVQLSVAEILEDKVLPKIAGLSGLVVTGYSNRFYDDKEAEDKIQRAIRGLHQTERVNRRTLQVLVLSDSMPNPNFQNAALPWYNGPFEGYESVWSLMDNGSDVDLVRHKIITGIVSDLGDKKKREWVETNRIQFGYDWLGKHVAVK